MTRTTTKSRSSGARDFLAASLPEIEAALDRLLPPDAERPTTIHRAMRYAVFGKGKRLRPVLSLAAAAASGATPSERAEILPAACGLELIHTYSLVHDDLPALDDDDLRRGRPTTHKEFGEAMAILAGDALLTHGLEAIAMQPAGERHALRRARAFAEVAKAIGSVGMIGGQVEDLEATAAWGDTAGQQDRLAFIHRTKTGCLITASLLHGAILGGADAFVQERFREYGTALGLAFQIADDILDVTGTPESLGKSPGKDAAQGKLTYPGLYGLEAARARLEAERRRADELAEEIEGSDGLLASFAALVADRES